MSDVTFVKLFVGQPGDDPFITEIRGPWVDCIGEVIMESFRDNPGEIPSWKLPDNTAQVWCYVEQEGDGHYDGIPFFWYLVPIRPLLCELFPEETTNDS